MCSRSIVPKCWSSSLPKCWRYSAYSNCLLSDSTIAFGIATATGVAATAIGVATTSTPTAVELVSRLRLLVPRLRLGLGLPLLLGLPLRLGLLLGAIGDVTTAIGAEDSSAPGAIVGVTFTPEGSSSGPALNVSCSGSSSSIFYKRLFAFRVSK